MFPRSISSAEFALGQGGRSSFGARRVIATAICNRTRRVHGPPEGGPIAKRSSINVAQAHIAARFAISDDMVALLKLPVRPDDADRGTGL